MMDESNPYLPYIVNIEEAWYETPVGDRAIKTFKVNFADDKVWDTWSHEPGKCAMVGRLGIGESMFCISSSPTEEGYLRFSIMKAGKVTSALHELEAGDTMTVRGPLGNAFPMAEWEGKNIVTIGGGIGQAPLRPVINYVRANRDRYEDLKVIYGARTSDLHCFKGEFDEFLQGGHRVPPLGRRPGGGLAALRGLRPRPADGGRARARQHDRRHLRAADT